MSTTLGTAATQDTDALPYVQTVQPGSGVTINNTDPRNPIISSTGGSGGTVTTVSTSSDGNVSASVTNPTTTPAITLSLPYAAKLAQQTSPDGASLVGFLQSGTGAVGQTLDAWIKNRIISVKDFGAKGDGVTDDTAAFNIAITKIGNAYGEIYCGGINNTYLLKSGLSVGANIKLVGPAILDFSQMITPATAYTLTASGLPWLIANCVADSIWFKGNETLTGNPSYTSGLTGLNIGVAGVQFRNCLITGFDYAETYANHSFLVVFDHCWIAYNNNAIYFNGVVSTMGENISHVQCTIGDNVNAIYNNQGELFFVCCSIDYNTGAVVLDNITASGGAFGSKLEFTDCHFESNGATSSTTRFTNHGWMTFNGGIIIDNVSNMFVNNVPGVITFTSDVMYHILETLNYTLTGNGACRINGLVSDYQYSNWRLSSAYSGIQNSDFETGSLTPWTITTGTNASVSNLAPYSGTYSLALAPTSGTVDTVVSSPRINIPAQRYQANVTAFMKNTNTASVVYLHLSVYDLAGNQTATNAIAQAISQSAYSLVENNISFPSNGGYLVVTFDAVAGTDTTNKCFVDDVYVNIQ